MNLKNKTALVTGGTDGLGLSVAKALAGEGVKVHVVSRNPDKHEEGMKELEKIEAEIHKGDVSKFERIDEVVKKIGNVDVLINNAGTFVEGSLDKNDPEKISTMIDTNIKGVVYTTKAVLPGMMKAGDGFIVNVSSTSGLKGREGQSVYAASKWAVTGFTESLKDDLKDTNIKVAGIYPGGMNTQIFAKAGLSFSTEEFMDTDKVAEVIIFMLTRDESMIIDHLVVNKRVN